MVKTVRGMGRLEDEAALGVIAPLLNDSAASVRAEAANAIAQAVRRSARDTMSSAFVDSAFILLRNTALAETHPVVLGVLSRSLGRLPYGRPDQARDAEEAIAGITGRSVSARSDSGRAAAPAEVEKLR